MSEYQYPRSLALAWLNMHHIPVKETATSMKIARLLKCWDGKGGAKAAKKAIIAWHDRALETNHGRATELSADEFYASQRWRRVRYEALRRSKGHCECCGATSETTVLHVDHIRPRSKYPELSFDIENLQVLCRECNLGKGNGDSICWR